MKNIFKKTISMLLSAVIALTATGFSSLATTVSAASSWTAGEKKTVVRTGDFSDSSYHFNGRLGKGFWATSSPILEVDGQVAYCISSDKAAGGFYENIAYTVEDKYTDYSTIGKALSYGYTGKTKYGYSDDYERNATQILVWIISDGWFDTSDEETALEIFTEEMSSGKRTAVRDIYHKIKNNMEEFGKKPSFNNQTREMAYNSSTKKWTYTFTDTNKVANKFDWTSAIKPYASYLSVSSTANTVTFTSTKSFDTLTLTAEYNNSAYTGGETFTLVPPAGYDIQEVATHNVKTDPPTVSVKLYAAPATGSCKLIKTSEDGKIEGIGFRLLKSNGILIGTYYTDSNGTFTVNDLEAETYIVSEIARDGYVKQSDKTVTIEPGETSEVRFNNTLSKGSLKLIKTSEDGIVSGISFNVYANSGVLGVADGVKIGTYITNSKGEILIPDLKAGTYKVVEIVPEGYEPQQPKIVTVKENETASVSFSNIPIVDELEIIKTSIDGRVEGFEFIITKEDGTPISDKPFVSDSEGKILIPNLKIGTYIVTEIVPEGYEPRSPQTVTVEEGKTAKVRFVNIPTDTGDMKIVKTSDDNRVNNITFTIKTKSGTLIGTYTTKAQITAEGVVGVIDVKLCPGEYVVTEKNSPLYEAQPPQTVTVETGKTTVVNFHNVPKGGAIQLTKTDENDHDKLLSGAVFSVTFSQKISVGATDKYSPVKIPVGDMEEISEGVYYIGDLEEGIYYITETKAPDGYELDTNTYSVKVTNTKQSYVVTNSDDGIFTNHKLPQITTLAASQSGGNAFAAGKVTIEDTVSYKNLIIGKSYTIKGILMTPSFEWDKRETGEPFLVGGKQITAEKTFTATTSEGNITLSFTFDTSEITQNTKVVVFEELYTDGNDEPIASHTDINDRDQTVEIHKPKITTSATSYNRKDVIGVGTITIDDSVEYSDLIVGEQYTVKGVLMDKVTGKAFTVNGKAVEAQTTFTATATEGTVAVRFTFNASGITANTKVVAYERLYYNGIEIAAHTDINDSNQTVEILKPQISTTATSMNEKHAFGIGNVTIDDAVAYSNLIEEQEYTLVGVLMDKITGKTFTVNGKAVEARTTFTAKSSSGTVAVRFAFDASGITANTQLVVYETLYRSGTEIASHKDINDAGQTVEIHKPSLSTTATSNGEKEAIGIGSVTINDVVTYKDLIVGKEYTVSGTLMDKSTAAPFTVNGKEITAQAKFTPTSANGRITVTFTFDASGITKNTKLVAYETLYYNGVEIANHKEIGDAKQTVEIHKPKLRTTATVDGGKETVAIGTVTVNDIVYYSDLIVGKKYTVTGTLMDKSTAAPFTVNGEEITAQAEFTPTTASGSVTVAFTFDASGITQNTTLVAYERLYLNGIEIAVHTNINDTAQTVELKKPKISTVATSNGEKETIGVGTVTINDTVAYHDLIIGKEYTVSGVLMNKTTGKPFTVNGKEVTSSVKFTAKAADETVTVSFAFDGSAITANTKLVVFETLYLNGIAIAVHADISDENQTVEVHKPSIGTTAMSNGEKETIGVGTVTIDDVISYSDLIIGKEYTVNGTLMNKTTGKPFTVNGKEITAQAKFTPTAANGTVTVKFTFDGSAITANTKLVAYERLYLKDIEIAVHTDINDQAQTVEVHKPSIGTTATSNGEKETFAVGTVTIDDVVSYKNLIAGKEYTLNGVLMNKATGKPFAVNGKEVTAQVKFTPATANGTVTVSFTFDASGITANTKLVAYERLFLDSVEIAVHTDINDTAQTVELHKPEIGTFATSDGEKETIAVGDITVNDTVDYHDLIVGKEYVVIGILMDKTTGQPFTVNGKEITAQNTFTAAAADEFVTVSFTFDGNAITENTKLVAFQTLYLNGVEIANHKDIDDEGQTVEVHKPEIGTVAAANGEKEVIAVGTITIDDVVSYKDLVIGKEYTVNGVLMDRNTGKPFTVNGEEVTAQIKFTAETTDGKVNVTFTFDSSEITENTKLVVFESLYYKEAVIAFHNDIDDEGQTVKIHKPEIETTADSNGEKETFAVGTVTINDIVKYHDLIPGKEYVVNGVLMNKETNEPFFVNGEKVTAQTTFVAETTDGEVTVTFSFDASGITENMTVVAFETMSLDGVEFAVHADIDDEDQTVELKKPKIGTVATINGEKDAFAVGETVIKDVISYQNLIVGKEYVVNGVLMNKETNKPFLVDGKEITAQTIFTAETADGEVTVTFAFDASSIAENMTVVAFETMFYDGTELAVHTDIGDEAQTVKLAKPEVSTKASTDYIVDDNKFFIVVDDVITFKNFISGKEYTIKGVLMDKLTGQPFLVNGKQITVEKTFIAEATDGETTVRFTIDATDFDEEIDVVVFETVYFGEEKIAAHADITDIDQTVSLIPIEEDVPKGTVPPTGVGFSMGIIGAFGLAAAAVAVFGKRRKK